jgi:hypothetical protein
MAARAKANQATIFIWPIRIAWILSGALLGAHARPLDGPSHYGSSGKFAWITTRDRQDRIGACEVRGLKEALKISEKAFGREPIAFELLARLWMSLPRWFSAECLLKSNKHRNQRGGAKGTSSRN